MIGLQPSPTFAVSTCNSHLSQAYPPLSMRDCNARQTRLFTIRKRNKTPPVREQCGLAAAHNRWRRCREWPSYPITLRVLPTAEGSPVPLPPEVTSVELSIYKLVGGVFLHHREHLGSLCYRTACCILGSRQTRAAQKEINTPQEINSCAPSLSEIKKKPPKMHF